MVVINLNIIEVAFRHRLSLGNRGDSGCAEENIARRCNAGNLTRMTTTKRQLAPAGADNSQG